MSLADIRRDYTLASLDVGNVNADPLEQFRIWFAEAQAAEVLEPNAMTLATATSEGVPSARVVLLKTIDERGLGFFTDYRSRKSIDLDENPLAALVFAWLELERQVRVEGTVSRMSADESASYYQTRPLGSRLGAWASIQSSVIENREWLESSLRHVELQYGGSDVPLPPHWGGFIVHPVSFEFWQGRLNRLHDRLRYRRTDSGAWIIERLAP
jgi:pyridoxamine 5'-phosphate oxidase